MNPGLPIKRSGPETDAGAADSRRPTIAMFLAVAIIVLTFTAGVWMLLPLRAVANCLSRLPSVPPVTAQIAILVVLVVAAGAATARLSRGIALALSICLLLMAVAGGALGAWITADSYFAGIVSAREACGRTESDAEFVGWALFAPSGAAGLGTLISLLPRPLWAIGAAVVALSASGFVVWLLLS